MLMKPPKPFDLVIVDHYDYKHIGQVISNPHGDGQISVRMVPDDPSTMKVVLEKQLTKPLLKYKWVHYAKVSGRFSFPVDMLRYDYAAPVNFQITQTDHGYKASMPRDWDSELVIAKCTELLNPSWTVLRWNSFSWNITHLKSLKIEGK